jgi:hypothetical protein
MGLSQLPALTRSKHALSLAQLTDSVENIVVLSFVPDVLKPRIQVFDQLN